MACERTAKNLTLDEIYSAIDSFLAPYNIKEEIQAEAYEIVPPICKSIIKTGIALADFHFGHDFIKEENKKEDHYLGIWKKTVKKPADACILLLEFDYPAMARLCAACMLPKLAHVGEIYVIIPDHKPSPSILVTLELCGIENIFILPDQKIASIPDFFPQNAPIFGLNGASIKNALDYLKQIGYPVYYESKDPQIAVLDQASFSAQQFDFATGKNLYKCAYDPAKIYDAMYLENFDLAQSTPFARLLITPGCEGFWLFPNISPQFFMCEINMTGFCRDMENVWI